MSAEEPQPRRLYGEEGPDGEPMTGPFTFTYCSQCIATTPSLYERLSLTDFGPGVLESIDPEMQCEDCGWSSLQ